MAQSRKAVVTGGASGIGRATVERLLREDVAVVAVDLDEEGLEPIRAAGAATLVADVGESSGRDRVVAAGDGIDYLVNAAGIIRLKPIFEFTLDDWHDTLRINAESIFFLCQQLGPRMREGGAIVNLSSSSAKLATTTEAAIYAASKTTILSVTRSFAYALAPRGVRVNAVCPGIVDTPMQDKVLDEVSVARGLTREQLEEARTRMVPLARVSSAEECAGLVWFLLSDESAYMTGQAVNWTGGMVTW
jgi:NAD(P)-dependent dehydrogenase (short-subunit alcohol dehydrogenase family)